MSPCPARKGGYIKFFAEPHLLMALNTWPVGDLLSWDFCGGFGESSNEDMVKCRRPLKVEVLMRGRCSVDGGLGSVAVGCSQANNTYVIASFALVVKGVRFGGAIVEKCIWAFTNAVKRGTGLARECFLGIRGGGSGRGALHGRQGASV
jgi:hypothetical protein